MIKIQKNLIRFLINVKRNPDIKFDNVLRTNYNTNAKLVFRKTLYFIFEGEFYVWTREAGAGNLEIYVEGLSKADIEFKGRKDESWCISYKVPEPGNLMIFLK